MYERLVYYEKKTFLSTFHRCHCYLNNKIKKLSVSVKVQVKGVSGGEFSATIRSHYATHSTGERGGKQTCTHDYSAKN